MRMWMIDPKLLCNKHLIGEHGELHKHRHIFEKGYSIKGRLSPVVQIEPLAMVDRHEALAQEMLLRGMNHKSPYEQPNLSKYTKDERNARVSLYQSQMDLLERCPDCNKRIQKEIK